MNETEIIDCLDRCIKAHTIFPSIANEALTLINNQKEEINSLNKTINAQMLTIATLRKEVLRDFLSSIRSMNQDLLNLNRGASILMECIEKIYTEKTGETI